MHTDHLNSALSGRYTIDRLIGEGGMATVYLARDVRHQRKVALKVLRPDLGAVLGIDRFLSEIQVTANLQHPNLLPLFDSGAADTLLFYVMPFIEGESLRARLDREKQLPLEEAVRIATAIASALDYAHRQGVIHRDLKPENILLHEGQPLVADFGIALAVSNAGGARITQTGLSLGTPQYMSPEQATGDRAIDGRTDIYSLGALTYEMLTGDAPHTGSTSQAIIARLLTERARSIRAARSSVPEHVEAAVERALEKLPADRWATAKEFSEALTGARAVSRTTSATLPGAIAPAPARKRPSVRELAAWGLAAAGIIAAVVLAMRTDPPDDTGSSVLFEVALPEGMDLSPVGNQATVAIDPEGTTLVFFGRDSAGRDPALYTRRLDDQAIVKIRGTDNGRSPILSPDGSDVLFVPPAPGTGRGGMSSGLRVGLRGGTPRTFIDSTASNGQVSWIDQLILLAFRDALWTMPAAGGARSLLATPDSARKHLRYGFPALLPGGKAALIAIWKSTIALDAIELGIVDIPSGTVTELGVPGTYPRYSPTGHVLFVTGDGVLMAAPFDSRSRRLTGAAFTVVEGVRVGTGGAAAVAVARSGTLVWLGGGAQRGTSTLVAVSRAGVEKHPGASRFLQAAASVTRRQTDRGHRRPARRPGRTSRYLSDRPVVEFATPRYDGLTECSRQLAPGRGTAGVHQVHQLERRAWGPDGATAVPRCRGHTDDWPRGRCVRPLHWSIVRLLGIVRGFEWPRSGRHLASAQRLVGQAASFPDARLSGGLPADLAGRPLAGVCVRADWSDRGVCASDSARRRRNPHLAGRWIRSSVVAEWQGTLLPRPGSPHGGRLLVRRAIPGGAKGHALRGDWTVPHRHP